MSRWSDRTVRRATWTIWWLQVGIFLVHLVVGIAAPAADQSSWGGGGLLWEFLLSLLALSFPLAGLLITHQQPRNRVGWLLVGVGLVIAATDLLDAYAVYGLLVDPGSLPWPAVAASLNEGSWAPWIGLMGVYLILLFPDGRLPSSRWRWLPWVAGLTIVLIMVVITLGPGRLEEAPIADLQNPIGVESLRTPLIALFSVFLPLLPACILAAAVALVLRFRRSRGIQRQQLKWLAEAGALVATCYAVTMTAQLFKAEPFSGPDPRWLIVMQNVAVLSFALLPLAIGIAVRRHQLYDIDVVINRTLVYGALTAALVGTYLLSVLLFRFALDPLTRQSDLAVAGSTLAVAAVFRPLRSRIQTAVDRRFYRSKYDAARTMAAFTAKLRHEVDLDALGSDLRDVVDDTIQPAHVSLWLRSEVVR